MPHIRNRHFEIGMLERHLELREFPFISIRDPFYPARP